MRNLYLLIRRVTLSLTVALAAVAVMSLPSAQLYASSQSEPARQTAMQQPKLDLSKIIVSVHVTSVSFIDFFNKLKEASKQDMYISYLAQDIKNLGPITINMKNSSVETILKSVLKKGGLDYTVKNNIISIVKAAPKKSFRISGRVVQAENKKPVVGASVSILNTPKGTVTDNQGEFQLDVNTGNSVQVSFIGLMSVTRVISDQSPLEIVLSEDPKSIENVVITGYANIKKNSFTGNATTIKGEDLLKVSRTNVMKAIQTFDPSFRIAEDIINGSDPNKLPEVTIRGRSSLGTFGLDKDNLSKNNLSKNPNTPTFIMDGFEVDLQKIYDLDLNRIQTMTILKDAAATAMYGSRAANGVIVITTVPPKKGETIVSYNFTGTIEAPDLSDYDLMDAQEKLEAERLAGIYEAKEGMPLYDSWVQYYKKYNTIYGERVNTDWMSLPLRNAFQHKHSVNVSGGNEDIRYSFDANYSGDAGVMKGSERNSAGAGFNLLMEFGKLTINNYVSYNNTNSSDSPYGSFGDFSHQLPYNKYRDAKGNVIKRLDYGTGSTSSYRNPMYEASLNNFSNQKYQELIDNLQLNWNLNDYLVARGQVSVVKRWDESTRFIDPKSLRSTMEISTTNLLAGDLYTESGSSQKISSNFSLSYNRNVNKHNINMTANAQLTQNEGDNMSYHYVGFPSGLLCSVNYASMLYKRPIKSESTSRTAEFRGILNYSYDDIYLTDLSLNHEGSSMFGSENKFANYWSFGAGVNIHNYKFMKDNSLFDRLKIRASYGETGNVNFPAYTAQNYYNNILDDWYITGYGTQITYLGNPNLKSEKTTTFDCGFDISMFNSRLNMKASVYNKITTNMINDVSIPSSSGFTVYKDNLGKVRNRGYEVTIFATLIKSRDFSFMVNGNIAGNRNKMVEIAQSLKTYNERVNEYYGDYDDEKYDKKYSAVWTKYEEGQSMTAKYGMRSLGINPANGKESFLNRRGEIVDVWDAREMVCIGDEEPIGAGSFGFTTRYKNVSLSAYFQYEFGGERYNQTLVNYVENSDILGSNVDKRVLTDRWINVGDVTPLKNIKDWAITTRSSSRFMQNYNALSLSSISLMYEFPQKMIEKIGLNRVRIEGNCNDLFRLSSVKQERGLEYPFARNFNFTLMLNF